MFSSIVALLHWRIFNGINKHAGILLGQMAQLYSELGNTLFIQFPGVHSHVLAQGNKVVELFITERPLPLKITSTPSKPVI